MCLPVGWSLDGLSQHSGYPAPQVSLEAVTVPSEASRHNTVHQNLPKSERLTDFEAVPVSSDDDTPVVSLRPNGAGARGPAL
jgi:hypothetical protein